MSTREQFVQLSQSLPERLPEELLAYVTLWLQKTLQDWEEAEDDAYCRALYEESQSFPDKGESIGFEEACRMLGVKRDELSL